MNCGKTAVLLAVLVPMVDGQVIVVVPVARLDPDGPRAQWKEVDAFAAHGRNLTKIGSAELAAVKVPSVAGNVSVEVPVEEFDA